METTAIIIRPSVAVRRPNCRDDNGSCGYIDSIGVFCKLFYSYCIYNKENDVVTPCKECIETEKGGDWTLYERKP